MMYNSYNKVSVVVVVVVGGREGSSVHLKNGDLFVLVCTNWTIQGGMFWKFLTSYDDCLCYP